MIIDSLKLIISQNREANPLYLRNLLKEILQYYVLDFVYNSRWGENLILKGDSCLRMFFDLPRLSEDLDLDFISEGKNERSEFISKKSFVLKDFLADLEGYFTQRLQYKDLQTKVSSKENIVYLKFPILDKLGLTTSRDQTRILFLRIDLAPALGKKYKIELSLKSTWDFSFLVKRYSIGDLFAGKISAILQRNQRIKGRDYFDLAWFLEKKVTPNFKYLAEITNIRNKEELKAKLRQKVKTVDSRVLEKDLMPLFKDKNFVQNFTSNFKNLVLTSLDAS